MNEIELYKEKTFDDIKHIELIIMVSSFFVLVIGIDPQSNLLAYAGWVGIIKMNRDILKKIRLLVGKSIDYFKI